MSEVLIAMIAIAVLIAWVYSMRMKEKEFHAERMLWESEKSEWTNERQQLLDRIQAPSFGELKHAEVKTIKAQQGIKEPAPLEPM